MVPERQSKESQLSGELKFQHFTIGVVRRTGEMHQYQAKETAAVASGSRMLIRCLVLRRLETAMKVKIRLQVQSLWLVTPTNSVWSFSWALVKIQDEELSICIDYV